MKKKKSGKTMQRRKEEKCKSYEGRKKTENNRKRLSMTGILK